MVKLSSVAEILNGDRSSNYPSGKDFIAYGIPFINAGHLKNGKIDFSNMDYISKQKYEQLSGAKIQKKDILLCLRGSLGKYAVAEIDAGAPASSIAVIRPNETIIASEFLTCIISSFLFQKQIDLENNGSSQPNLSASSVANFIIPFPPLDEQKRIAEALSDVDSMISSLEKLIAKKKAVKQGTMQELLTGKKRLPGFTGEWKPKMFRDVCFINAPMVDPAQKEYEYLPHIGNESIEKENGRISHYNLVKDDHLISGKYYFSETDVLYGKINPQFAKAAYPKFKGLCSADMYPISCGAELNPIYLLYILLSEEFTKYTVSLSNRSGIPKVNREELAEYLFKLPPIKEQTAIASVLFDMDNEIESLEQKLKKTCQLKQGMMQRLLTGKIRLV